MKAKKNIALFMGILENDYSNLIMQGAIKGARECDVNIVVFPIDIINAVYSVAKQNTYRYQKNIFSSYMSSDSFDGVVVEYGTITSYLNDEEKAAFLRLTGSKPTYILAEKAEGYSSICMDNESGLIEVMEHLISDHKFTKIAYLSGPSTNYDAQLRLNAYTKVMKEHNLYLGDEWIYYGNFSEYIEEEANQILNDHPDVEAIVCANDGMALGVSNILKSKGIIPGEDIKITGFDNVIAGYLNKPSLTTVKADPQELSRKAIHEICENKGKLDSFVIKTTMVKRASCGCGGEGLEEKIRESLGIPSDWRDIARFQLQEDDYRHRLEDELSNIARELVFNLKTPKERYQATLDMMRRFDFRSAAVFLYDHFIEHKHEDVWENPETVNLVGYYSHVNENESYVFDIGEQIVPTNELFRWGIMGDGERHEVIVLPLYFGISQIGFINVETEAKRAVYAADIAGEISSILYTVAMNEEQDRIKHELEEANKSKDHFLANMSHEIRTPINAIIGFNEMILRENHDTAINDYARDVKSAADALLLLVNDILDFSKIEAGKMDIIDSEYKLLDLINGVVGMISSRAKAKGLELKVEYDDSLPSVLEGDFGRIQQILINLLSNAVKYTQEGSVTFRLEGSSDDNFATLKYSISDTGIGIKEEDINRLFNRFERIEEKRNRNIEGTGLGINITTGLLSLMGSKLIVTSEYGFGSTFSFTIKQRIIEQTSIRKSGNATKRRDKTIQFTATDIKLLVVDDNALNRKVVKSLLKETGVIVDQAAGGQECIDMVSKCEYDLILLDHMMPNMDGVETLEKLYASNILKPNQIPIIALTANAIKGAKEFYLEHGFTGYLSKPVLPQDLYEMLISVLPEEKIKIEEVRD